MTTKKISTGTYTRREKEIDSAPFKAMEDILHKFAALERYVARSMKKTDRILGKE
jgi:hypothetical protein